MADQPKRPVLKQDPLVERLRPDPSEPPAVELQGFLGKSEKRGYWRLYLTPEITEYVEIAEADIIDAQSPATGEGSCIWVKGSAVLQLQAEFLRDAMPGNVFRSVERSAMVAGAEFARLCLMPWAIAARGCGTAFNLLEESMTDGFATSARSGRPRHFKVVGVLGPRDLFAVPDPSIR